jgi:hypothetical protein
MYMYVLYVKVFFIDIYIATYKYKHIHIIHTYTTYIQDVHNIQMYVFVRNLDQIHHSVLNMYEYIQGSLMDAHG